MTTTQNIIAQTGQAAVDYLLEFRTWNGAAYVWTDYTDRLVSFSGIGSTVEQNAFPNAFRMSTGSIEVDNTDGMFDDLDVLDGKLYNAAEPYGKSIYKRMVRITDVRDNETKVIGVALVRDVKPSSAKRTVIIETISLDARAADQMCDAVTAERHPLGGTTKAASATWTTSNPASATTNVNMYRWREQETDSGELSYGWFKDRHYADVIERTAWALDDLATNITKTYRLMTSDGREIATTRNIPPDDPAVSVGVTPDRCRAVIWNPVRNVLVCCVGHLIYDYDPVTNVYTLRNTLTAGRDVVRAFYTTEADSGGKAQRIVLVQCDINSYVNTADLYVTSAWCTVLDASGTGAYTLLANQVSLGTDVFPGTHFLRYGRPNGTTDLVGQSGTDECGENIPVLFNQRVDATWAPVTYASPLSGVGSIFDDTASLSAVFEHQLPRNLIRAYYIAGRYNTLMDAVVMGIKFSLGQQFSAALNIYNAGGRLYYQTYDVTNGHRLNYLNLSTYAAGTYLALGGSTLRQPYFLYSPKVETTSVIERIYCCQMNWDDTAGAANYSDGELWYYDLSVSAWTQLTPISGATGSDQAWMVMEIARHKASGSLYHAAILFNRDTWKWRFCYSLGGTWTVTDANCVLINGKKDQDNRLEGLYNDTTYTTERLFFVEAGANFLWSYTNALIAENVIQGTTNPAPVCSDRGLGSFITGTGANYPDSATPNGVLFWVSANDYLDAGADHPAGRYVLCQYANFDPGFVELLDVSGLSFWQLRTLLAERVGFVHYYAPDGTMTFKPRTTSGTEAFSFSSDNRNLINGQVQTRGFEAIVNDVTVFPYAATSNIRTSEIIRGYNETAKTGAMDFPEGGASAVNGDPGENSQWKIIFVSATTYDLYKIAGANASATVPKTTAQSISSILRAPTDGVYLTIAPDAFSGQFVAGDNFTFWALQPQESLEKLDERSMVRAEDAVSIAANKRAAKTFDNRFIRSQIAVDYVSNILVWRKVRHDTVQIEAVSDPNYLPLLRCVMTEENMGYGPGNLFQIMGVQHRMRQPSNLLLVKV